jgi:hypothetical protein
MQFARLKPTQAPPWQSVYKYVTLDGGAILFITWLGPKGGGERCSLKRHDISHRHCASPKWLVITPKISVSDSKLDSWKLVVLSDSPDLFQRIDR